MIRHASITISQAHFLNKNTEKLKQTRKLNKQSQKHSRKKGETGIYFFLARILPYIPYMTYIEFCYACVGHIMERKENKEQHHINITKHLFIIHLSFYI